VGYPLTLARRYMASKKRNMISLSTVLAVVGVTLGVAALAIVMSVTGGFQEQFREKVLGVNAHVLVLKYSIDFREYRDVMKRVEHVDGVVGVAPFVINPMMVTHGDRTATGVLLKGVDPDLMPKVLDLPKHIIEGSLVGLRKPGAKPPERTFGDSYRDRDYGQGDTHDDRRRDRDLAEGDADAGSLFDEMRRAIDRDLGAEDAGARAAEPSKEHDAPAAAASTAPPSRGGRRLVGAVTPDGGYASSFSDEDDDFVPESIVPDPCKSPEQVAKLPGVVVGKTLAKQLGVDLGDCVQITSPTIGISFGAGARPPIAKQFRLIAVFEAGFDQYDSKLVYTDLYEAQAFYEYGDSVTGVEMKVSDITKAEKIAREIDGILQNGVYHTMDWRELNHGLFTALLIQQIIMSVVLAIITGVASFTVIATLVMIVLEKKKEIALIKALGATSTAVLRIFFYQGAIIGTVGTTLGLVIGYVCCKFLLAYGFPLDPKVYFISKLPVSMEPVQFVITGVYAMVTCLTATLFPALYAARLRPADGLRAE
jgi:lipoprotein-releasing system permease protein